MFTSTKRTINPALRVQATCTCEGRAAAALAAKQGKAPSKLDIEAIVPKSSTIRGHRLRIVNLFIIFLLRGN